VGDSLAWWFEPVATRFATRAIVLRTVAYGEADLVVTLLGATTGRLSALARGARKSARRFGGGLGMGAEGQAALRERPGADLLLLEEFDVQQARLGLAGDMGKTAHAAYALELCDRLCPPRHAEPAVFDWLREFLLRLEAGRASAERLRVFELGLLGRLGLAPALERCAVCGRSDLGEENTRWHADEGGVLCASCARRGDVLSVSTRRTLARLARMALADAEAANLDRETNAGCRRAILGLLRTHISGPLRSLDFIEKMGGDT
jgi:DNA repair protein RecO (recombination protein O)